MKIKRLWNNKSILVVKIGERWFALNGWNGEYYEECWETDENTFALDDGNEYEIAEKLDENFEIIGYELV